MADVGKDHIGEWCKFGFFGQSGQHGNGGHARSTPRAQVMGAVADHCDLCRGQPDAGRKGQHLPRCRFTAMTRIVARDEMKQVRDTCPVQMGAGGALCVIGRNAQHEPTVTQTCQQRDQRHCFHLRRVLGFFIKQIVQRTLRHHRKMWQQSFSDFLRGARDHDAVARKAAQREIKADARSDHCGTFDVTATGPHQERDCPAFPCVRKIEQRPVLVKEQSLDRVHVQFTCSPPGKAARAIISFA